ncbi:MAG TPA: tripartite tricarboxylate transporter permease, partial [Gammaproteobacteria bacterium]|nr:tripartite tricarboxylate transporter permease [Gammaproteobacteria bacterium]
MSDALFQALIGLATVEHFAHLALGVGLGLAVGAFPGLGGIVGLSMVMPFLYGMDTISALATLVGLVAVIPTSDTFTSILMGIPGSSASQATVLDGFPLAQQGQASRALAASFSASLFGGLVGAVLLSVFVQMARPLILTFGSAELFMLALFGLSMVGVLSGRSLVKGLTACAVGLVVGSIGGAPATGEFRLTFGIDYFYDGLPLVIVGIGLFAFPEIVDLLRRDRPIAASGTLEGGWLQGFRDVARNWWLCLRCSSLGTLIGAIPGLGGTVVDWIAYGHVVQTSKDKSRFGKGDIRGVIAPESANNAKEGGGLVPTLLFGIPGSGAMAVFLGGLVLLGIEAGPAMVSSDIGLTYTIIWSLALANVLGAGTCILLAKPIARLTTIPFNLLAPFMIMVVTFAAFQATRDLMDLVMLFGIGIVGIFLKRFGWSRPAFLIGFVLAPQAEGYLNLAVQFYGWGMFARPGVVIILLLAVVSVWLGARGGVTDAEPVSDVLAGQAEDRRPQLAFIAGVAALSVYAIVSSQRLSPLGSMFPMSVAIATLLLAAFLV